MRFLAILAVILFTQLAGASTCFDLQGQSPDFLPRKICYDSMILNLDSSVLYIDDSKSLLPEMIPASRVSRRNEDFFRFEASTILLNQWNSGCRQGLIAALVLKGQSDNWGSIIPEALSVTLEYEYSPDTCHSASEKGKAIYQLRI